MLIRIHFHSYQSPTWAWLTVVWLVLPEKFSKAHADDLNFISIIPERDDLTNYMEDKADVLRGEVPIGVDINLSPSKGKGKV